MIFFLDIDGVLCTMRVAVPSMPSLFGNIDPIAVSYINLWGRTCDADIVFTSTWRSHMNNIQDAYMIRDLLGLHLMLHDSYKTKPTNGFRGDDINLWLEENGDHDYLIIDDDGDFHPDQKNRLIQTDGANGILLEHHHKFEEIINAD